MNINTHKNNKTNLPPTAQERGSVLILTILAVFLLSLMVTGLMNVGTTEVYSTQNYQLSKTAYYTAVQGVEEIRNLIYNYPDAQNVITIKRYFTGFEGPLLESDKTMTGTTTEDVGFTRSYITGTMKDMEEYNEASGDSTKAALLGQLEGFKAPPLPAISLGGGSSIAPVVWKVNVTSQVKQGARGAAYAEILSGVYSILTVAY